MKTPEIGDCAWIIDDGIAIKGKIPCLRGSPFVSEAWSNDSFFNNEVIFRCDDLGAVLCSFLPTLCNMAFLYMSEEEVRFAKEMGVRTYNGIEFIYNENCQNNIVTDRLNKWIEAEKRRKQGGKE